MNCPRSVRFLCVLTFVTAGAASQVVVPVQPIPMEEIPIAMPIPRMETAPVPSSGDAADDPAIWIHPNQPADSVILGTDKQDGLVVVQVL